MNEYLKVTYVACMCVVYNITWKTQMLVEYKKKLQKVNEQCGLFSSFNFSKPLSWMRMARTHAHEFYEKEMI